MTTRLPLIIAHRGESLDAPENTLSSVNLAWEKGAQAVEIDIHLSLDNEIVVIHDYNTLRITGVNKNINQSSLQELRTLNAGYHKGAIGKNEHIPTLKEVLNTIPADCKLIIEIKSDIKIIPILEKELILSGLKDKQIEIIAFDFDTITRAKQQMPQYKMLWLLDLDYPENKKSISIDVNDIINKTKQAKLDGIDAWAGNLLTKKFIAGFKKTDLLVYAWTVNDPVKAKILIEMGIDGITTDRAAWMQEQLNKLQT